MAKWTVKLDKRGIGEILRSPESATVIGRLAQTIAGNVRAAKPGADVAVEHYVTDRAASAVVVREPDAAAWQAKDGLLTRAATAAGLEVKARKR